LYDEISKSVSDFVAENLPVARAITSDGWRADCGTKYYSFTLHVITKDWRLRRVMLGLEHINIVDGDVNTGRATGENLASLQSAH